MLKLLLEGGVLPSPVEERAGDEDDAHPTVLAGSLLHGMGNRARRRNHPSFGVPLAASILNRLLPQIYEDPELTRGIRGRVLRRMLPTNSTSRTRPREPV